MVAPIWHSPSHPCNTQAPPLRQSTELGGGLPKWVHITVLAPIYEAYQSRVKEKNSRETLNGETRKQSEKQTCSHHVTGGMTGGAPQHPLIAHPEVVRFGIFRLESLPEPPTSLRVAKSYRLYEVNGFVLLATKAKAIQLEDQATVNYDNKRTTRVVDYDSATSSGKRNCYYLP